MNSKEFKKMFGKIAKQYGFKAAFDGWFRESSECIVVLDLQKSNYGNFFYLNIKANIQGVFGKTHIISKYLIKNDIGDVSTRQPKEYDDIFDLDLQMMGDFRLDKLDRLFQEYIVPYTNQVLTKEGIEHLYRGGMYLLPAVKEELGITDC